MSDVFGKKLGQYILLEQLGEGGMAKVYNALDSRAERNVAIKVILPNKRSSQIFLQQFEQEAKSLANLIHTNIVKVLNYGIEDGQPYLVMEFVPGGTLKEAMQRPLPWQTAAAVLAPIARALEYVHRQQIVHRDVKPSNILLDENFRPMLSDFGIVKLLESKDEDNNSAIGVGVGTPDYMSPEQGMGKDVDFRADIYSLGLVYYEMVTGKKPFAADTPMAAVIRHITDEIPLPSAIDKTIPRYVENAMLRAIQKDPEDRYPSMGTFADVLESLALGKDAPAKEIIRLSQRKKRKERIKVQPKLFLTLLIPLALVLFYFAYGYWKGPALQPSGPSISPSAVSVAAQNTATQSAVSSPTNTQPGLGQPTQSAEKNSVALASASEVTLRGTPLVQPSDSFKEFARWGIGGVNVVKWSPDGKLIALGTTSGIFFYDADSKQLTRFINTNYDVIEMTFSPDGNLILAGSLDGQVKVWQIENGEPAQDFGNSKSSAKVTAISYSPNGKNLAIGHEDGTIHYYVADQTNPVMTVWQPQSVQALAISSDNRFLYVSNGENKIIVWDIAFQKVDSELVSSVPINKFDMSRNGQFLLSAGNGNAAYLWDMFEGHVVSSFSNLGGIVTDLEFSNDDKLVVISLNNGTIKVFAIPAPADYSKAQRPLATMQGLSETARSVTFSPDQGLVASGNWKDGLKIWNTQTGNEVFTLEGHMAGINELYFSPDGTWLVTAHEDKIVRVWDVKSAQEAYQFEGYLPKGLPFSPDQRFLTIARAPQEKYKLDVLEIVELSSGKIVAELPEFPSRSLVQFTDDSKLLVAGNNHFASLWDVSTWEQLNTHGGMNAGCGQYFTPENDRLAVIYDTGVLFSYDQKVQDLCSTKPNGTTLVYYFEIPHRVFFVLSNGKLWNWDFLSADIGRIPSGAPYPFPDDVFLAADQDSGWYAYASGKSLVIQNISAGKPGTTINTQDDYHYRVAFLPSQKLLALGSQYGSIHIWTTP